MVDLPEFLQPPPPYPPELCGLCGAPSADECQKDEAGGTHEYIRADVLACTLLHRLNANLETVGKLLFLQNDLLKKVLDPQRPNIVRLH